MKSEAKKLVAVLAVGAVACLITAGQATAEQCHDLGDPTLIKYCDDYDNYCDPAYYDGEGDCQHSFVGVCTSRQGSVCCT